jgi:hypothetical protein
MMQSAESFLLDNRQLSILFYCHGVDKITYGVFFCYDVALTDVIKAETWVFRLRAVQNTAFSRSKLWQNPPDLTTLILQYIYGCASLWTEALKWEMADFQTRKRVREL